MEPETSTNKTPSPASPGLTAPKSRLTRARKRRRVSSDSSSDTSAVLPENLLEVEKNLHASAVKNNLDDVSVKKILKTVVTNDHVLALVKLQEEEENMEMHLDTPKPKLTRSKAKELRKVSPKTAWNLENLELTPIKHIPVKTRPEVTALIAQELPDDEDDEEYDPAHDESDDDQTLESCSDLDSQPRTPATPRTASPRVPRVDGPFKVPQDVSTPRRKLDMDEEATIALRTRSKLSLSAVPIDHIEGSFVPPDEAPMPAADDVWTEFLQVCMNPDTEAQDDDDDPEYNVAQDPDAHDEDEEGLENIMKISKKELNDLVTELFSVMPEGLDELGGKLASETGKNKEQNHSTISCKQETLSEEETPQTPQPMRGKEKRLFIGKSEPLSDNECHDSEKENRKSNEPSRPKPLADVIISVVEGGLNAAPGSSGPAAPPSLQNLLASQKTMVVQVEQGVKVLPEQIEIFQQQLRQHVQLATSNFLQLFVHPMHWSLGPTYKEYLETFNKMVLDNPDSVANVCNLKPAMELVLSWEKSVSEDTPENKEMVEFVQKEIERCRRRAAQNSLYVGDFPKMFLNTVSNSSVFLYPHLLPPLPYRSDGTRKFGYLKCEDELLALGIDQFWKYVDDNPDLYTLPPMNSVHRPGLIQTLQLVCKHMFPWIKPKGLLAHIRHVRKHCKEDVDNAIVKLFDKGEVTPVKHMLLPFNEKLTLYEQPENEIPKIWVRHLAKNSRRFRRAVYRRGTFLQQFAQTPPGAPAQAGAPDKRALPPDHRFDIEFAPLTSGQDVPTLTPVPTTSTPETTNTQALTPMSATHTVYNIVQTPTGAYLVPVAVTTKVTNSATAPICSSEVQTAESISNTNRVSVTIPMNTLTNQNSQPVIVPVSDHCPCCVKLRQISKTRQTLMTEFLKLPKRSNCPCKEKKSIKYPRATKKLRLLVNSYKSKYAVAWSALQSQSKMLENILAYGNQKPMVPVQFNFEEVAAVTSFQLKLTIRSLIARNVLAKKRIFTTISQFNPDTDNIYVFMKNIEKILNTDGVDVYKELLGFLTMEQADKIGNYVDYFNQECLTGLMKKIQELVACAKRKHEILKCLMNTLSIKKQTACDVCSRILDACVGYPALAEHVFSLFPHTDPSVEPKNQNKVPIFEENKTVTATTNRIVINTIPFSVTANIEKNSVPKHSSRVLRSGRKKDKENAVSQTTNIDNNSVVDLCSDEEDNTLQVAENIKNNSETIDNTRISQATDNIGTTKTTAENMDVDKNNTKENEEETVNGDLHVNDYEADNSASDDDSRNDSLIINEDTELLHETDSRNIKIEEPISENKETPHLTTTKTEVQDYSESDMSMMIMSEDEQPIKTEFPEWKRNEDKTLLEVLKQSLTPEEMKDKTILEIIEHKKVLKLASESLPQKSFEDVRERILYLLEFLVLNEQMIS